MPVYDARYNWWTVGSGQTGFTVPAEWVYAATTNATTTTWYGVNTTTTTWSGTIINNRIVNTLTDNRVVADWLDTPPPAASEELVAVRARREAREQVRVHARERADELLLSMLSPEQVADYVDNGAFDVIGSAGGRYRIRRGVSGNVDWIDTNGQVGGRLCAHPTMEHGWMPDQDVALAQLLALTTDEVAFVAVANVHHGRRPPILVAS